ncbi:MAG TPA: hypothetical protein VGV09_20035 [Steroidobacteraceae bacterium]|nr:hypothetical protein [Steroidobacteraceae bacterium]
MNLMHSVRRSWLLGCALMLLGGALRAAAAVPSTCDEACLKSQMDAYLQALQAHDASRLKVAPQVRFTENGVAIPLGEALWVTFSGLGPYRHDFFDPASGAVASYVTMRENGTPGYLMVRLKVAGGELTQIETVVVRDAPASLTQPPYEPRWDQVEPQNQRLTRRQLIDGALGYMRAVALAKGSLAPFAESCIRLENGMVMALGPHDQPPVPLQPLAHDNDWAAAVRASLGMGCSRQLDTGVYAFINEYDNARFPLVDVPRQIVFAVFDFRRRGTVKSVTMPNGRTYPMMPSTQWPNEVLNTEAWKFQGGKITRVEAVFLGNRTYKQGTGWPGGRKGEKRPL